MNHELKPCPFCGSKAYCYNRMSLQHEIVSVVKCENIGCVMCSGGTVRQTREQAIEAWNKRVCDPDEIVDQLKRKSFNRIEHQCEPEQVVNLDDAIEIVKGNYSENPNSLKGGAVDDETMA